MCDRELIAELGYRYTFALDDGDFPAIGDLLDHATLTPSMPGVAPTAIEGKEAIVEFYTTQVRTYSRGRPMTRHLVTNQVITFDDSGLEASSRAYFTVLIRPPEKDYHIVVGGQYLDEFVKTSEGWRFRSKTIRVDHLNDIETHFHISPERSD